MKLLVSFGGIAHSPGLPPEEFKNVLSGVECDIVFVTDIHRAWYYRGIDEAISTHYKVVEYLQRLTEEYDEITFFGNSMGGFAAILFGSHLEVDKVISFSPQTFLGRIKRKVHNDTRWSEYMPTLQNYYTEDELDLVEIMNRYNFKTIYDIHYLKSHRLSRVHAERLRTIPRVKLFDWDRVGNLVQTLRDENLLKDIIMGIGNEV